MKIFGWQIGILKFCMHKDVEKEQELHQEINRLAKGTGIVSIGEVFGNIFIYITSIIICVIIAKIEEIRVSISIILTTLCSSSGSLAKMILSAPNSS